MRKSSEYFTQTLYVERAVRAALHQLGEMLQQPVTAMVREAFDDLVLKYKDSPDDHPPDIPPIDKVRINVVIRRRRQRELRHIAVSGDLPLQELLREAVNDFIMKNQTQGGPPDESSS